MIEEIHTQEATFAVKPPGQQRLYYAKSWRLNISSRGNKKGKESKMGKSLDADRMVHVDQCCRPNDLGS